ncbi:hypothetical protein EDB83DRAFT_2677131 [Lactarius deliciosus]|nr:hypothetical protein EDB83DRAFT_2677131 [Lactarius deliciosus]
MRSAIRVDSVDQYFDTNEPWQFIVLRSQNMGMLRPEKSWRPIITLEVDGRHKHEVILGVDGQNPNQRDILLFHHAHYQTQIKLDVWHKSQSKAKSRKRRRLVASASMALGDAVKRQGTEPYVELSLSSIPAAKRKSMAQNSWPSLLVRLRPPQSAIPFLIEHSHESDRLSLASSDDKESSDTLVMPGTDEREDLPPWSSAISEGPPTGLRRRKKVKGYCINSEEERSGESDYPFSGSEAEDIKACDTWEPPIPYDESSDTYPDSLEIRTNTNSPSTISPSLIPTSYVDNISVTSGTGISYASSTFDTLTYHRELREAQATRLDSDFDRILGKLLQELIYYPSYFPPLRDVDTTVFGFSSGNLFDVDGVARRALIISSVASALGLFVDVWFILAYSSADVHNFQTLAVDLYGSYFFFALSSRLPLVALFVAVLALVVFLGAIAWAAWPAAVLVMCVLAGVLVGLQFIVYGCHRVALGLAWMVRGVWFGVLYVSRAARAFFGRGAATAAAAQGEQRVASPATPVRQVVAPPASADDMYDPPTEWWSSPLTTISTQRSFRA